MAGGPGEPTGPTSATRRQPKALLALDDPPPDVRMAFRIRNRPLLRREGDEVEPRFGEPGGGTE